MGVYGRIWLPMVVYGCIWLYKAVYGRIWLPMAVYVCRWLYMGIYGVWLHMVEYCVKAHGGEAWNPPRALTQFGTLHQPAKRTADSAKRHRTQRKINGTQRKSAQHKLLGRLSHNKCCFDAAHWSRFILLGNFRQSKLFLRIAFGRRRRRFPSPPAGSSAEPFVVVVRRLPRETTPKHSLNEDAPTYQLTRSRFSKQHRATQLAKQRIQKLCYPSPAC